MSIDRHPKKPCKLCKELGHFTYQCRLRPRKELKRTPIKKIGKTTQRWLDTRAQWIADHPPTVEGKYWLCYLRIHPWCPVRIDRDHMTLDHVVSRSHAPGLRFEADNLRPACSYCNTMKGSRSLDSVKPQPVD